MRQPFRRFGVGLGAVALLATVTLPPAPALGIAGGTPSVIVGDVDLTAKRSVPAPTAPTYGQVRMSFEKNAGQSAPGVDFVARGAGYTVLLAPGEAVLALKGHRLRMALVGSNPARAVEEDELAGKANYFVGRDPATWRTGVPTFARVRYPGVYPGIDVVYYGNQRLLEYDFIASPGSDPSAITLAFTGAHADIEDGGDLVLSMAGGSVTMPRPHIYQEIDGTRRVISGGYVKRDGGRIGFQVGAYDRARPLVIDPVLLYSTYLGGSSNDVGNAIAVDASGNAYVTGWTISSDFPAQSPEQGAPGGGTDVFVAKIDPSGSALVYSTYFGGGAEDIGSGIAVDPSGHAYVTGWTGSTDFSTTPGAYQTSWAGGGADAFVAKFDASGALVYSTYLGADGYDLGRSVAVDASGNAYVAGFFYTSEFPTTPGAYQTVNRGAYDAFVSKLNASGSALVYSTYLGGNGDDRALGLAVDSLGNAYVTGETGSSNFPTTTGSYQTAFGGHYDAFVTKVNPTGSALVYSTYLGGSPDPTVPFSGLERGAGIAVDPQGNAHVAGQTGSSNFPTTPGAYQTTFGGNGNEDAFVAKFTPSGAAVYVTYLGGSGNEAATAIAVDPSGSAYVTGNNYLGGFPLKDPLQSVYHTDSFEGIVAKFTPNGALEYSTYLGGAGNDLGLGIAVDALGNAYVVGHTQSTDFPTTPGAYQEANAAIYDAFVVKIAAASVGRITGGGSIAVAGGIGTLGFTVQRTTAGGSIQGNLQYINRATGAKVHSVSFTSFSIAGATAAFGGTCSSNGVPCTFAVTTADNGEPGVTDTFSISISGGPTEGGTLRSGNIQIHQ